MTKKTQTTILYDGGCKVCSWEMENYQKKDLKGNLLLVDINDPNFKSELLGLDAEKVKKVLHVKNRNGEWITGVEAFAEIWSALDRPAFNFLARSSRWPGVRSVLGFGYSLFTHIRPWLPRKDCESGTCSPSRYRAARK